MHAFGSFGALSTHRMAAEGVPLSTRLDRRIGARRMTASGHHQSIATNFRNGSSTEASACRAEVGYRRWADFNETRDQLPQSAVNGPSGRHDL